MFRRFAAVILALALITATAAPAFAAPIFTDTENHWACDDIDYMYDLALLYGVGSYRFAPDSYITRGMFVTVLGRYYLYYGDYRGARDSNASFSDVDPAAYYAMFVYWAAAFGFAQGVDENHFAPDAYITRQDLALVLYRYSLVRLADIILDSEREKPQFTDADEIRADARQAVEGLYLAGIVNGRADGAFDPRGYATRAEVAAMFTRMIETIERYEAAQWETAQIPQDETSAEETENTDGTEFAPATAEPVPPGESSGGTDADEGTTVPA